MDNATLILRTLDRHLTRPTRLILYGRAALQPGFRDPPPAVAASKDVDVIIPPDDVDEISQDESFWRAQEAANRKLDPLGLYLTHLFKADQVFLRSDWERHLLPIGHPSIQFCSDCVLSVPQRWT